MGIDNLILSHEIISELYPETLIGDSGPDQTQGPGKTKKTILPVIYPVLGKNRRFVCFLVSSAENEFLPAEQLNFLTKILGACKMTLDDIALINTMHYPLELQSLKEQLRPKIIFLWGSNQTAIDAGEKLPDMQVSSVDNFLVVPVRSAMMLDRENPQAVEMKQKLWSTLKNLFVL